MSTNTAISEEEIIYGIRWDIEAYFKMCKSFLGLAKEFQARDYDAMVAHTTLVCVRYLLLKSRKPRKQGRLLLGRDLLRNVHVENISFAKTFVILLELFTQVLRDKLYLPDDLLEEILDSFLESLPGFLKRRLLTRAA